MSGESVNRRLAGLGVLTRIAHLLGPGEEPIVQLAEAGDTMRFGFAEEAFAYEAVEPLELAAAFGYTAGGG